jgi:hypothetical protein
MGDSKQLVESGRLEAEFAALLGGTGPESRGLATELAKVAHPDSANERGLDLNVPLGTGGYAFRWDDVLALSTIIDALKAAPAASGDVSKLWPALIGLVRIWGRLREVRIAINEEEYRVLRAVKSGAGTREDIATASKMEIARVADTLKGLQARKYMDKTPLVEVQGDRYTTRF